MSAYGPFRTFSGSCFWASGSPRRTTRIQSDRHTATQNGDRSVRPTHRAGTWRLEWGLRANRLVVISDPVIEIPDLGTVLVESLLSDGPQSIKMIRQRLNGYSPPRLQI